MTKLFNTNIINFVYDSSHGWGLIHVDTLKKYNLLSSNILPGITRDLLIYKLKEAGIKVEEGKYSLDNLLKSKSIWLTSSTKGLALVTDIIDYDIKLDHENFIYKKCETIFRDNFLS